MGIVFCLLFCLIIFVFAKKVKTMGFKRISLDSSLKQTISPVLEKTYKNLCILSAFCILIAICKILALFKIQGFIGPQLVTEIVFLIFVAIAVLGIVKIMKYDTSDKPQKVQAAIKTLGIYVLIYDIVMVVILTII